MINEDGTFVNSKSTITYNESNTLNIMVPLIPFNCLFDTDVGLIKLINQEYNDSSVFDQNTLDSLDTNIKVVKFVYKSSSPNILLDIMIDKNEEVANEYYNQFMQEEYANILRNSVYTDILFLLEAMLQQADINVTVFCARKEEVNFIREYVSKDIHTVLPEELLQHIDLYKQFYFKHCNSNDIYFKTIYQLLSKSTVYILDYANNFDSEGKIISTEEMLDLEKHGMHFSIINAFAHNFNEGDN